MDKKMEISCSKCNRQFKLRTSMEKHQHKCQNLQSLQKRIKQLEAQLQETYGVPSMTFQQYIERIIIEREDITNEKPDVIYSKILKRWISSGMEIGCVRMDGKMIFDENQGWISTKKIQPECAEKISRIIQSKLLGSLTKDKDYYKNVIKLTKKWNIYKHL